MNKPPAWDRAVFRLGSRTFTIIDVIGAAKLRGELDRAWEETLLLTDNEDAETKLSESDENAAQANSELFRAERGLITAEETETWLDRRGLTIDDFGDFFVRHCGEKSLPTKAEVATIDYVDAPEALRDLLRVELLMGGEFDRLAARLAWRAVARDGAREDGAQDLIEHERQQLLARAKLVASALDTWLARLGCDATWFEEMLRIEAAYQHRCRELLTPGACERALIPLRIPLTQVELEIIELESLDAAREAVWCVRDDGMTMAEVAQEGRYPYRSATTAIENLPADFQQKLLCTAPGALLEPAKHGDGFQLCRLLRKHEPDLAAEPVRRRVEQSMLERHFSELAAQRVQWMFAPHDAATR